MLVGTMLTIRKIVDEIMAIIPRSIGGPLSLWGNLTGGRPAETGYTLTSCDATGNCLRLRFGCGEVLAIWEPVGVSITKTEFWIDDARAMRWTQYSYGRPLTAENLYYNDYARQGNRIAYRTNRETVRGSGFLDDSKPFPAVYIYSIWEPESMRRTDPEDPRQFRR